MPKLRIVTTDLRLFFRKSETLRTIVGTRVGKNLGHGVIQQTQTSDGSTATFPCAQVGNILREMQLKITWHDF